MLKSMTGYVQATHCTKNSQLSIEMRSLNHRFLECVVHLPEGMGALEDLIKGQVRNAISRGRVTVVVSATKMRPDVVVDYALASRYIRVLRHLNQKLKLKNELGLSQIIHLEGVLRLEKPVFKEELMRSAKFLVAETLQKLVLSRQKEGKALARDIIKHIDTIKRETRNISGYGKEYFKEKKKKIPFEDFNALRKDTDIAEETTRLNYHIRNFAKTIKRAASCGKELDFVAQEIQREANTISAKAQDARASYSVVKIKSAIDKIREQLQNVE